MSRPSLGIKCWGVVLIISGLFALGTCGILFLGTQRLKAMTPEQRTQLGIQIVSSQTPEQLSGLTVQQQQSLAQGNLQGFSPEFEVAFFVVTPLVALGRIVGGIGLLILRTWAYWLTLVAAGLSIAWSLRAVGETSLGSLLYVLGFHGAVLWYFLRPGVKAQFVRAATSDPSTSLGAGK